MLSDLNDFNKPINEIFEKYFDYDNYFTWMAFHLATGNTDTIERNFLIYSPLNAKKWYFISWDCDYAPVISREDLILKERKTNPNETGVKTYWTNLLHRRVLSYAPYRKLLDEYIQKVRSYVTPEKVALKAADYNESIRGFVLNGIDTIVINWLPVIQLGNYYYKGILYNNTYDLLYNDLPYSYERYYQRYLDSLEDIMPFFISLPERDGQGYKVYWDPAYSFTEKKVYYQIEIASDILFKKIVYSESDIMFPYAYIPLEAFPEGRYFLMVKAYYGPGYYTASNYTVSNEATSVDEVTHYGVFDFNIDENGDVIK
jgi:spore coat protein H